jgi:hypothetical protein
MASNPSPSIDLATAQLHLGNAMDTLGRTFADVQAVYLNGLGIAEQFDDPNVPLQILENLEYLALKHNCKALARDYRSRIEALEAANASVS